jgi:hypothetical protein
MQLDPVRIIVLVLITAGITAAAILIPLRFPEQHPPSAEPSTWLPIPKEGMDARQWAIRELLLRNVNKAPDGDSLAQRCGSEGSDGEATPTEKYSIQIGNGAFVANAQHWQVDFVPDGEDIDVSIQSTWPYPPPPPPPPSGSSKTEPSATTIDKGWSAHYRLNRKELQPIRDALSDSSLWLAPQEEVPFGCVDGRPVTIEACVRKQYIARMRNCDDASGKPAQRLWDALRERFPSPIQSK